MDDLKEFTTCRKNRSSDRNCCVQVQQADVVPSSSLTSSQISNTNELSKITLKRSPLPSSPRPSSVAAPKIMTQTISTQTTPTIVLQENQSIRTPSNENVLMMNCTHLKVKTSKTSYTHFSSDHSVSSIKNVSSLSNHSASLKRSIVETSLVKRKIIRSTSTPLQVEMMKVTDKFKPNEHTFGVTGISTAQISSICANESDASAGNAGNASIHQPSLNGDGGGYPYRKIAAISSRAKMLTVTPLRHVMSKSIHRAIAAQNFMGKSSLGGGSVTEYSCHAEQKNLQIKSPMPQALDLRLSPAVRRSKDEGSQSDKIIPVSGLNQPNEVVLSARKVTTESIVITTRTKHIAASITYDNLNPQSEDLKRSSHDHDHAYHQVKTHTSGVQILKANTKNKNNRNEWPEKCYNNGNNNVKTPITRIPGAAINKKLIKFEESPEEHGNNSKSRSSSSDSNNEIFFTPNTTPNNAEMKNCQKFETENNHRDADCGTNYQETTKSCLKYCAHSTGFSCVENSDDNDDYNYQNTDDDDDGGDDVFIKAKLKKEENEMKQPEQEHDVEKQMMSKVAAAVSSAVNVGGLWSALMSSMTRFSSMKSPKLSETNNETFTSKPLHNNIKTKSIIQKCASLVTGTLMKPTVIDEIQRQPDTVVVKPLKRKRPSTTNMKISSENSANLLSTINSSVSPPSSDLSNISTKRFRIQGRRPIYRLRFDT